MGNMQMFFEKSDERDERDERDGRYFGILVTFVKFQNFHIPKADF